MISKRVAVVSLAHLAHDSLGSDSFVSNLTALTICQSKRKNNKLELAFCETIKMVINKHNPT